MNCAHIQEGNRPAATVTIDAPGVSPRADTVCQRCADKFRAAATQAARERSGVRITVRTIPLQMEDRTPKETAKP